MKEDKLSDMMLHWKSIKQQYNDCIIFYRLGDFYEMFFDDAIEASKLLDLTLTARDCGGGQRAPMCGVPYHASENYISKLVSFDKKVAICEQLSIPGEKKGLVDRDVIKVVTKGTLTSDNQLDENNNNFIACVYATKSGFAISWADITTGEFFTEQSTPFSLEALVDSLVRINPSEIITNEFTFNLSLDIPAVKHGVLPRFSLYKEYAFSYLNAKNKIMQRFNVSSISAFLDDDKDFSVCACGALFEYLEETQKQSQININSIRYYDDKKCLKLDSIAIKNLEIVSSYKDNKPYGSLFWAINNTTTSMGARKLKSYLISPLYDIDAINYRLDGVEDLYSDTVCRENLIDALRGVYDLERLCGKLSNNVLTPKDVLAIYKTLECASVMKIYLSGKVSSALKDVYANLGDYDELLKLFKNALSDDPPLNVKDGGFVKDGFDSRLDEQRKIQSNVTSYLKTFEAELKESTGIRTLKVGYNKVFGYYIEVSNSFKNQVPYNFVRKQTLVNGERYITEELKDFEVKVLSCSDRIIAIETEIFNNIKDILAKNLSKLLVTARCIAFLDVILSFATTAKKLNYSRPQIMPSNAPMEITGGRHPVVEKVSSDTFIPNDTILDLESNRMVIVTGPNMAGKSTYMRQIALITILAQCGSFVPAKSAKIPLVDKIFTRIGASDYLIFDQSTFMVEMTEVAKILHNATKNSLLIFDEVGRGTSTFDGLSIAWAVVEFLANNVKAKTVFATHYHELSEIEGIVDGVKNYKITVKEINGKIVFLRKIMRGSANKSFGIEVASLAGIPEQVTKRAKAILRRLEKNDLASKVDCEGEQLSFDEDKPTFSEVENIIRDLDINRITPLQAFEILQDLKGKV